MLRGPTLRQRFKGEVAIGKAGLHDLSKAQPHKFRTEGRRRQYTVSPRAIDTQHDQRQG